MAKVDSILREVVEIIKPSKKELQNIQGKVNEVLKKIKLELKKSRVDAGVFVGGSFAKKTVIKKDYYDVDVFLRFNKKYPDEDISKMTEKIIGKIKYEKIHGSRDYFRIKVSEDSYIELIPVKKINNPKEAENITDLSYSHVKYINKKIKTEKLLDEIRIAKAFCHANNCYGAESYVGGFSGYALELLVYHYRGFLKFIKEMTKVKEKLVVDIEKHYKNKNDVFMDVNSSKLKSPIVLIDPTYKQRNALAALSDETFKKFQDACQNFLKNPSIKYFEIQKINLDRVKNNAVKKKNEFALIEIETDKQEGDIAGSKLLKFYRHLEEEISRYFKVKEKGFEYDKNKTARVYFVVKNKGEIILHGPEAKDKENVVRFRKKHKNIFAKGKKIYAKEKIKFSVQNFLEDWKKKNAQKMREMYVVGMKICG
jgi:tRNA nucleotidyltransferase (CCA-adding enzyme)